MPAEQKSGAPFYVVRSRVGKSRVALLPVVGRGKGEQGSIVVGDPSNPHSCW